MVEKVQQGQLVLASKSPRRRYLLQQAGLKFTVMPSRLDESEVAVEAPDRYVQLLSAAKAGEIAALNPDCWVLGADTIVVMGDDILGKPRDKTAARLMLQQLSGTTHEVYTGYTISCAARQITLTDVVCTRVTFKRLSGTEIEWYIQTDEPFDKAGAYAILGLPVCEVIGHLFDLGVIQILKT
jgi:septum formation protein